MDTSFFADIEAKQRALKNEIKQFGKEKMQKLFTEFFDTVPDIERIVWTQFTPYFNDGDPCEFGVHDLEFYTKEMVEEEPDQCDYQYGDGGAEYSKYTDEKDRHPQAEVLATLNNIVCGSPEIMEVAFGDHVTVTVTRDGIDVEEYDHD